MSLYNMVCGTDPLAGPILGLLGFKSMNDIPRFRDAYLDDKVEGDPTFVVFTRTGGGNRQTYELNDPEHTPEGPYNDDIRRMPGYIDDFDDDFDSTFAHFRFRIPDEVRADVDKLIAELKAEGVALDRPMDRFKKMMPT